MEGLFEPTPITLNGAVVRLEPLSLKHAVDLYSVGRDEELWQHMPRSAFCDLSDAQEWIASAEEERLAGRALPFATILCATGRAVGSTRFLDIRKPDRALEIGWTWLGRECLRSAVNTECKWLLMSHAFETLGAVRVQLKTDARNLRSQAAIERLGAVKEGILRKSYRVQHDFHRDSVYYSVLDTEWPAVRERLKGFLARAD
jgi:RimJ/RimL family protein N-acetyltransferase